MALIATYGELFIFVVVLVEEAGLPLPLPSDLMLLFCGSLVAHGRLNLGLTFGSVVIATILGTAALFTLARWGGRPLVLRYGRWIRLDESRLQRAEQHLRHRALWRLTALRLIPGLRVYSTITAGVLAVPRTEATLAFALSGAIWASVWIGLGALLGPHLGSVVAWQRWVEHVGSTGILVGALLLVAGLLLRTFWSHSRRAGARSRQQP
jgi:membrane protein DedA with SNARE-associated domain